MDGKTFDEIQIGETASFSKTISTYDIYAFAGVTGDLNPMHVDAEYTAKTRFGQRIAHGILSVGLISSVLGTQLPGVGSVYLSQTAKFIKPVFIGDTVTATVEIIEKDETKKRVKARTYCTNQRDELLLDGEATLIPRKE